MSNSTSTLQTEAARLGRSVVVVNGPKSNSFYQAVSHYVFEDEQFAMELRRQATVLIERGLQDKDPKWMSIDYSDLLGHRRADRDLAHPTLDHRQAMCEVLEMGISVVDIQSDGAVKVDHHRPIGTLRPTIVWIWLGHQEKSYCALVPNKGVLNTIPQDINLSAPLVPPRTMATAKPHLPSTSVPVAGPSHPPSCSTNAQTASSSSRAVSQTDLSSSSTVASGSRKAPSKRFNCNLCVGSFASAQVLRDHVAKQHGGSAVSKGNTGPAICPRCNRSFLKLSVHLKTCTK